MTQVTKEEFTSPMSRLNAVPDGFKRVGAIWKWLLKSLDIACRQSILGLIFTFLIFTVIHEALSTYRASY